MARPRVVRLDEKRELHLYNMTSEDAVAVKDFFEKRASAVPTPDTSALQAPAAQVTLDKYAVSTYADSKRNWHLVVVAYNVDTKEAEVVEDRVAGYEKAHAIDAFKKEAVYKNLV